MFIECSDCKSKYLVNSADLKPNGRMVECANCSHQWFQEIREEDEVLYQSVPSSRLNENIKNKDTSFNDFKKNTSAEIKNLPSTVVNPEKVSALNSILVVLVLFLIIFIFWLFRSYGINIFVLINFYIHEFFFNLRLIINDIALIIHQSLN